MGGERARIVGSILALIILTLLLNELQLRIGNTALSELQNMYRDHVILSEVGRGSDILLRGVIMGTICPGQVNK